MLLLERSTSFGAGSCLFCKNMQGNWSVSDIFDLVSEPVIGRAKAPGNMLSDQLSQKLQLLGSRLGVYVK